MFYVSRETFWRQTRLWKQICYDFSKLSGQLESIQRNLSYKMSKVQSTCQDEQFEEKHFLLEKNNLPIFFRTWTENCQTFGQTLPHGRQNALYISREWFCRECIDFKFNTLYYLGILSREVSDVSRFFFSKGIKTAFHVFKRTIWANMSFWQKKTSSNIFGP